MVMAVGRRGNMEFTEESPSTGHGLRARCPVQSSVAILLMQLGNKYFLFDLLKEREHVRSVSGVSNGGW